MFLRGVAPELAWKKNPLTCLLLGYALFLFRSFLFLKRLSSFIVSTLMCAFQDILGVREVNRCEYVSLHPPTKPHPSALGVYGDNIVGQSLLVAIRSSPEGFTPNSLHTYFLRDVSRDELISWKVTELTNGRTFCHRNIKAYQSGDLKYIASVSLTKKNTHQKMVTEYEQYMDKVQAREAKMREKMEKKRLEFATGSVRQESANGESMTSVRGGQADCGDNDKDEDEKAISKPFEFQTPYPDWLKSSHLDTFPIDQKTKLLLLFHKVPHEIIILESTKGEDQVPAANRRVSCFVRLGGGKVKITDPAFRFVGLAELLELMFLSRVASVLQILNVDMTALAHLESVSLDHTIYFHDTDFDCTNWLGLSFRAARFVNGRVLLEAEMYNSKGIHIATVIQERLVCFYGVEEHAKL